MNLGEALMYRGPEIEILRRSTRVWTVCAHCLCGRTAFDVDACQVFPLDALATFTCKGCDGDGRARAYTGCEPGLHCSAALRGLFSQWGPPPIAGVEALRVSLELALFLLSVGFYLPTLGVLPKKKGVLKQVKLNVLTGSSDLPL